MKLLSSLLALGLLLSLSGCSVSNQKGTVMPGADLSAVKSYYVSRLPADTRGVNQLICDNLIARGAQASTGEAINIPAGVDAVVTYQDKWYWDITMYMLELKIQIRNPKTEVPLATGESLRTSLARRSPKDMVKEVLDKIFEKAGAPTTPALGS